MSLPYSWESWTGIPGYAPYEASNLGRIRRAGRVLEGSIDSDGYRRVSISIKNVRQLVPVHTLIALAFLGPRPTPEHEVAHWDGTRTNNRKGNLRWATPAEQYEDRRRHGTDVAGDKHPRRKLCSGQANEIRARYAAGGATLKALAADFGVSHQSIHRIVTGKGWLA